MAVIRNFIFLVLFVILAFFGIRHGIYDLFVSIMGPDTLELNMSQLNSKNVKYNRLIKITDAYSLDAPLEFSKDRHNVDYYVYVLLKKGKFENSAKSLETNIVLESKRKITDWTNYLPQGLLKPHWYYIDQKLIDAFEVAGISIDKKGYYLVADQKPWKWYWYVLIIAIASLFIYRLVEAIVKGLRKYRNPERMHKEDSQDF